MSWVGVHTWADGRVYSGTFENGKENGFGTLSHSDGVKYRGQFKNGVKEGYGIMLWKTRTYDGEWYVFHQVYHCVHLSLLFSMRLLN